ncbi:hypothetical protein [Nostoc sp.]|uniref:hypothetical protein n=1 Tax=Nostoc sp. TaxID=1180 RepID=UPI002FFA631B
MVIYSRSLALIDYISSKTYYDRRIIPLKIKVEAKNLYKGTKEIKFPQYLPDSAIPG